MRWNDDGARGGCVFPIAALQRESVSGNPYNPAMLKIDTHAHFLPRDWNSC